ncbi:alanyl-tRNA editing protein [Pelosinus fermentans]|uniref:Threonyl/alanyl tRNA synthetase SAD n=1 Tax=Pelosinus fermentans JBW45 TaxID=1192197 RepID=I9DG04_9FIRM|nr:alanyl-tRNA editing protein [Pelosinus fermentans]AJQ26752.1 Threonyl/alanyl tRNA synthetase SAD [Pelosinus fermentans JBW45]
MTVKKLFWEDPYLKQCTATVMSVDGNRVTLDKTIVFAFSGGQASDSGTIHGYPVMAAQKVDREIVYEIEADHDLQVGQQVEVIIDWEKRYKIMKLHFAAEIVLELMVQNFNDPKKIGANITAEKARVDFEWHGNISEVFPLLQKRIEEIIDSSIPILSCFSDEEREIRYWKIDGFGKVPCGGTHIKNTGEIGAVLLKRGKRLGANKERIEIYLC